MGDQILSEKVKQSVVDHDLYEEEDASVEEDLERLPFTDVNDVTQRNRRLPHRIGAFSVLDKENSPKGKMPASRQRLKLNSFEIPSATPHPEDLEPASQSLPTTPTRELEEEEGETEPPLTPTANLKVLLKVVSPDLKKIDQERERQRQTEEALQRLTEDSTDCADNAEVFSSQDSDTGKGPSRKEKSLGLLCSRFLQMYPPYPSSEEVMEISLDDVARTLNVERRRIYDIVNVLESVEMVSRVAKNKYAWHGKTNLTYTLAKLKALAEKEGFAEQIRILRESEMSQEPSGPIQCHLSGADSDPKAFLRKDKSLGIMSQKFLMLFLVSKPSTVNLDMSAKILIGDAEYDKTETAKYKTKIRRLYDIANILTSLGLITKVYVTDLRGRKPAFQYIGPEINKVSEVNVCCNEGPHRPSSRHSMLDCVRNEASESSLKKVQKREKKASKKKQPKPAVETEFIAPGEVIPAAIAQIISKYPRIQPAEGKQATFPPSFSRGGSAEAEQRMGHRGAEAAAAAARRMPRHSSFEQICRVAESERSKLYASTSEPSSPVKKLNFDEVSEDTTPRTSAAQPPTKVKTAHTVKLPAAASEAGNLKSYPVHLIQVSSGPGPSPARSMALPGVKMGETIIISGPRPGVFTVDQVNALLRSITVPIPVPTTRKVNRQVDASTQSSPSTETSGATVADRSEEERSASPLTVNVEVKMEVEDSPVAAKRPSAGEVGSAEAKRPKLQLATPVTTEEDSMPSPCDSGRFSEESHGAFEVPSQEKSPPADIEVNGSPPQIDLEQPVSPAGSSSSGSSCSSLPTSEASSPALPPQIHKVHQLPPGVRIIHTGGKPILIQGTSGQLAAPMVCQLPLGQDAPAKSTVLVGVPATTAQASVARLVSQLTTAVPVTFSPPVQVPVTFSTLNAQVSNTFTFPSGVPRSMAPTHIQIIHPRQSTAASTLTTSSSFTTSPSSAFSPLLGTLPPTAQPQGSQSQQLLSPTTTIGAVPSVLLSPPVTTRVPGTTRMVVRQAKKLPQTPVSTITTTPTYLSPVTTGMAVPDTATPSQSCVIQAASSQQALTESAQKRAAEDGKGTSAAIRSALRNAVANRSSNTARKLPLCDPNS